MNEKITNTPPLFYSRSEKKVILAVDNDSPLLWFYNQLFDEEGYDGLFIDDAPDAIELAQSIYPDLLIFSIKLAKCNGFDLLARMRKVNPHIRSLLITGYGEGWYEKEILDAHPDNVFVKPADFKKVDRWISTLLDIDKAKVQKKPLPERSPKIDILCVDNKKVALQAFQSYFKQYGFFIDMASSSEEAVEKAGEKSYDILIADRDVTPLPCEEMVKAIMSNESHKPAAGAIYGSRWTFAQQVPYIRLQMEPFFSKPVRLGNIIDWVEKKAPDIIKERQAA